MVIKSKPCSNIKDESFFTRFANDQYLSLDAPWSLRETMSHINFVFHYHNSSVQITISVVHFITKDHVCIFDGHIKSGTIIKVLLLSGSTCSNNKIFLTCTITFHRKNLTISNLIYSINTTNVPGKCITDIFFIVYYSRSTFQ